jgi:rhodanese-related sulfurtransferase/predicted transcriptional regulator
LPLPWDHDRSLGAAGSRVDLSQHRDQELQRVFGPIGNSFFEVPFAAERVREVSERSAAAETLDSSSGLASSSGASSHTGTCRVDSESRTPRSIADARLTFKHLLESLSSMDRRPAKDELFAAFASAAKALGNGRRAEIIDVLAQGERSVDEIAAEIGQSVANTSQHLHVLADAGLVRSRRAGVRVFYSPASDRVVDLWNAVREVASEHVAAIEVLADVYLGDRSQVERIGVVELAARLANGSVVLLDVRPRAEYRSGHVPGAESVPIDDLPEALDGLRADVEVVAYCRGPYCVYADDAVRLLRAQGRAARRLDVGFPEWRRAGLPVAVFA